MQEQEQTQAQAQALCPYHTDCLRQSPPLPRRHRHPASHQPPPPPPSRHFLREAPTVRLGVENKKYTGKRFKSKYVIYYYTRCYIL